jgi:excisionase family DNA binding protein
MSSRVEQACRFAIQQAKKKGSSMVTADHLFLGCLRTISQFGVATIGRWNFDLEELGVDWLAPADEKASKVAYAPEVVDLLNLGARIARANADDSVDVEHVLAAFAARDDGLFGKLARENSIGSAEWRIAISNLPRRSDDRSDGTVRPSPKLSASLDGAREYLTPEEAAEILGIHVQTVRSLVPPGRLPGLRLAGERAIRLRRSDLEKVFEPAG